MISSQPPLIAVLDYGMGNRRSVEKAFERTGARIEVTGDLELIGSADGLVLPGVGAFPKGMEEIGKRGLDEALLERAQAGVPVLGICLGMQLLFERSEELKPTKGLGLLQGSVKQLSGDQIKLPHIGWNRVTWVKESPLTNGLGAATDFYHVHSFAVQPTATEIVLGYSEYGGKFVSAVSNGSVFGVQFHPEKSSNDGLKLIGNFVKSLSQPISVGSSTAP